MRHDNNTPPAYLYRRHIANNKSKRVYAWIAYDLFDNEIARCETKKECIYLAKKAGYIPNICN